MLTAGRIASRRAGSQVRGQSFNMMMVSEIESAPLRRFLVWNVN
jgi:hypothetical protein